MRFVFLYKFYVDFASIKWTLTGKMSIIKTKSGWKKEPFKAKSGNLKRRYI